MTIDIEKYNSELNELNQKLENPSLLDSRELPDLFSKQAELNSIVSIYNQLQRLLKQIEDNKTIQNSGDSEMIELAKIELPELEERLQKIESELKVMLVPVDPNDSKNVIVEIRAGTGGEEAALFAGDLFRMYTRFANIMKWQVQIIDLNTSDNDGIKEAIFKIVGKKVYGIMKYESGVHRVQRVPATESAGRIHTSAASVVVMPEVDDIQVNINPNDLKIDVYRSSGNGGQSVNTTDSAVRITHLPSGIVVTCQDTKDQQKNKATAMSVLKSKLYQIELEKQQGDISDIRKSSIKTGDRSDKIKTYNFQQDRLTDHRIKKSWFGLPRFLNGDLEEMLSTTAVMLNGGEVGNDEEN